MAVIAVGAQDRRSIFAEEKKMKPIVRHAGRQLFAGLLCLVAVPLLAGRAQASSFSVSPMALDLSASVRSGAFTVVNSDTDKLDCQVNVKAWSQDASGKDVFTDAGDIVFFPKIMTVEPNGQRAIRVGVKIPATTAEKTYRLFVEEIPSPKKPTMVKKAGNITAGLSIAFQYAVPIFVTPLNPRESGEIDSFSLSQGTVKASVKNTGNVHFKLLTVTFTGRNAAGTELFSKEIGGWYVLQGMARPYAAAVPQDVCARLAVIDVKAQAENFEITGTLHVQKKMCEQ